MLITLEGVEGSGKSTQTELLYDYLRRKGHDVIITREPGGTRLGEALRKTVLGTGLSIIPLSELFIIMAARAQHVEEVIAPALGADKIIVCDRFVDASHAYQGYGRGIDPGVIETLNGLTTKGVKPDLTILLDCDVGEGFKRKRNCGFSMDRFEEEEMEFHKKVRGAYLKLAQEDPERFFVVDGKKEVHIVHGFIRERVIELLKNHGI